MAPSCWRGCSSGPQRIPTVTEQLSGEGLHPPGPAPILQPEPSGASGVPWGWGRGTQISPSVSPGRAGLPHLLKQGMSNPQTSTWRNQVLWFQGDLHRVLLNQKPTMQLASKGRTWGPGVGVGVAAVGAQGCI